MNLVFATRRDNAAVSVFIEADRHHDARELARRLLGDPDPYASALLQNVPRYPLPRWQVRWVGTAASNPSTLRMQARKIAKEDSSEAWQELHDVKPG